MKTILMLLFIVFSQISFAQLIDPFGKIITHEIKLEKLDNGMYAGATEWTTGGIDSIQKFVIKDLDVKAPVMVRIISKAPDHNIDLSFHKKEWDKVESKISTDGEKFAHKTFRTMGTAGIGVSSKVAGIPYLITVKVGLQFPSTQSLIRFTDDKEEYTQHMRKMGYMGQLFEDDTSTNNENTTTNTSSSNSDNTLMYIVIALLAIIAILFAIFLMKSKFSKTTIVLLCTLGFSQVVVSQGSVPHTVPITDMRPVFVDYQTQNVANQVPVTYGEPGLTPAQDRTAHVSNDGGETYQPVQLQPNQGSVELSGDEVAEIQRRMNTDREQFNRDYGPGSPGEDTEGDQRTIPLEDFEELKSKVEELQRQVDLLSQEDEEAEAGNNNQRVQILQYCEQIPDCKACIDEGYQKFQRHYSHYQFLQRFYLKKSIDLKYWISWGNTMANLPGGGGIGWNGKLIRDVRPAMDKLKKEYDKKFDYYIVAMETDLRKIRACTTGGNRASFPSMRGYDVQVSQIIIVLKATRITQ